MGKRFILILILLSLFALIYLPGPNGLFALIRRGRENQKLKEEIIDLRVKNILLRAKQQRLSSPEYWQELVRRRLSQQNE